uniref:Uncharacterized protein n=1 Tax=Myoviridae sp. ctagO6 TaxID=2826667 RepID=A0A8S5NPV7_9CAUD|nr:MAG TPA: hypothetical protein [Myoviridae sp. ctagO6]DAG39400.1 MAG TPA: hypothetical protein [Caudoviricetes sp.]
MTQTTPLALAAMILAAIGTTLAVASTLIWMRKARSEHLRDPAKMVRDADALESHKEDTPEYLWAYHVVGSHCGRDRSGVFRCFCGKCVPVRIDLSVNPHPSVIDSKEGKDCRCDGSERGNGCNCGRDYEAPFLRASL